MIRYCCDMCGRSIVPGEDTRYVVKIEVYTACDSMEDASEFDEELIDDFEDDDDDDDDEMDDFDSDEMDDEYKTFRFDLCSRCHSKYLQDPLSIKSIKRGRFSEN